MIEAAALPLDHRTGRDDGDQCVIPKADDPLIVVLFGATGDLVARMVFPALRALFKAGRMPQSFLVVGSGRSEMDHDAFRARMREALGDGDGDFAAMAERLRYVPVDMDDPASFEALRDRLADLDAEHGTRGNRLLYLSVPPGAYGPIAERLSQAGMNAEGANGNGWVRIVVEKPFGHDLQSARQLNETLLRHFDEHQIFRIDHYMAKDTVQNIILLRFANLIFEPLWNREYIDRVVITAAESIGVGHRAGYYEKAGVLRDMFQNHMMMLLSLCAMEPPPKYGIESIRDEKSKVFRALKPFPVENIESHLVLGQYAAGSVGGKQVPGYRDEPGAAPDSTAPTYAMLRAFVDNWRWQGVPFYLTSGKRLKKKLTRIMIHFKTVPHSLFRGVLPERITPNRLTLGIQPEQEISLSFETKAPGAKTCLRSVLMHFDYLSGYDGPRFNAYETALLDCMLGDQTLFWRQDAVDLCWSYLTPILEHCEDDGERLLHSYPAGSWGPSLASGIMPDGTPFGE